MNNTALTTGKYLAYFPKDPTDKYLLEMKSDVTHDI